MLLKVYLCYFAVKERGFMAISNLIHITEINSSGLVPSMHVGEHASRIDFRRDLPGPDLSIFGPAAVAVASIARPEDFFRVAEEHDELGVFRQFLVPVFSWGRLL
jgi:hypothetical protein